MKSISKYRSFKAFAFLTLCGVLVALAEVYKNWMVMLHYDEPSIVLVSTVLFEYAAFGLVVFLYPWSIRISNDLYKKKIYVSIVALGFSFSYIFLLSTIEWLEFGKSYNYWNGIKFSFYHLPYVLIAYAAICYILRLVNRSNSLLSFKYAYVKMTQSESEQLFRQITELLNDQEYYLRNNLKLSDVSDRLEVPVNKVSRAINENFGASFSDLVNSLRVNHAKILLSDPTNDDKLFAIAMDSGFNNKVSFHNHFKNFVGMSPQQYREKEQSYNNQLRTSS